MSALIRAAKRRGTPATGKNGASKKRDVSGAKAAAATAAAGDAADEGVPEGRSYFVALFESGRNSRVATALYTAHTGNIYFGVILCEPAAAARAVTEALDAAAEHVIDARGLFDISMPGLPATARAVLTARCRAGAKVVPIASFSPAVASGVLERATTAAWLATDRARAGDGDGIADAAGASQPTPARASCRFSSLLGTDDLAARAVGGLIGFLQREGVLDAGDGVNDGEAAAGSDGSAAEDEADDEGMEEDRGVAVVVQRRGQRPVSSSKRGERC